MTTERRLAIATVVTVGFVVVLARDADLGDVASRLRDLPPRSMLVAATWLALAGVLRALRLPVLLSQHVAVAPAYAFHQLYNVVTAMVPTGLSEAASAWVLRRSVRVPLHVAVVALMVGRMLDLFVLLCLFIAVILAGGTRMAFAGDALVVAATALAAGLLALALVHSAAGERLAARLQSWAAQIETGRRHRRILRRGFALLGESLILVPRGRRSAAALALTLGTQLLSLKALQELLTGSGLELSYAQSIVCFVVYALLRMLPIQGIGGVGTTAAWWAVSLRALGVAPAESVAVGAALYVAFTVLLLLLCVTALPFLPRDLRRAGTASPPA